MYQPSEETVETVTEASAALGHEWILDRAETPT